MKKLFDTLFFLLGMALGIIFAGIIALCMVNVRAESIDNIEREIQVVPEPVTLVEISIEPKCIQGLAQGDPVEIPETIVYVKPSTRQLTKSAGRVMGPTNEETWYNLPMEKVIQSMRNRGYSEEDYPFYIREDGVKMLGDFVMVAADLDLHPKGTVVTTSVGQGLVCDTGEFENDIFDVAVDW